MTMAGRHRTGRTQIFSHLIFGVGGGSRPKVFVSAMSESSFSGEGPNGLLCQTQENCNSFT